MSYLKNIRIIILIVAMLLAVAAINPRPWQDGVTIRNVEKDSAAALAGISPSAPAVSPVLRERVISINDVPIESVADYEAFEKSLAPNVSVRVQTNKQTYVVRTQPLLNTTVLPQLERVNVTESVLNNETGEYENRTTTITQNKTVTTVIGVAPLGLTVYPAPKTNIRFGLDISGGARVLLQPERPVTDEEMDAIISSISERLNVYGLSDIVVRPVSDLSGSQFILVEMAGASESDVRNLIQSQGKFEAKIGEDVVFRGGNEDITYVCRSAQCARIAPNGCSQSQEGYVCPFDFSISLSSAAAARQGALTENLSVVTSPGGRYLEKPLDLYLDDIKTDSLQISDTLRGSEVTQISISGAGTGATQRAAAEDAVANMKQLQTILQTGSLPVKLNVVKTDSISSELGEEFIKNSLLVGVLAFLAVTVCMVVRYRNPRISIPVMITLISELVLILGIGALTGWSMDLAGIAGILVAIGTGVDDQIVIADETIGARKKKSERINWKEQMKKAFFIILAAYFTALAAMIPLWWAGAGLVRGFAITSIIGITIGVLVTRPAFAVIMERLEGDE